MSKYQEALDAGYSDEEIKAFMQPKIDEAKSAGYSEEEIGAHLGVDLANFTAPSNEQLISNVPKADEEQVNIIPTQSDIEQNRANIQESLDTQNKEIAAEKAATQEALENPDPTIQEPGLEMSFLDPAAIVGENALVKGVFTVGAKVLDAVQMNPSVRKFMERMTDDDKAEYENTINFMDEHGLIKTDFLLHSSKGKDTAQYLSSNNLFATRDTFLTQEKLKNDYLEMTNNVVNKLKAANIDPKDINSWRNVKQAEGIIKGEVKKLRKAYKDIEKELYSKVTPIAKSIKTQYKVDIFTKDLRKTLTEDGVPPVAVEAVNKILNRFAKPFKEETTKLAALNKSRQSLVVNAKKLKAQQKKAIADGNSKLAEKLQSKIEDNSLAIKENVQTNKDLRDVKYMNTEDLLASVKLINSKLFKPGGTISMKDADELRGLQIAKTKLNEFIDANIDNPELKKALSKARDVTKKRSEIFGPKDTGGIHKGIADMLEDGNSAGISEFVTGPNAKENILYVRDILGKDSAAYKQTFSLYLNDKLGLTVDKIGTILDSKKALGISNRVDISAAADKIASLDAQDFAMIKQVLGEKEMNNLKSLKGLMQNYSDLENAASKYGRGITGGKLDYVEGTGDVLNMPGRGMKLIRDAITYHMAKTAEKVVYNQPKFRTLTGALVGATVNIANTKKEEDITLEGLLTSMLIGGGAGYAAGRVTRSALESDINKVSRYLREGKSYGKGMPKGISDALGRLGQQAKLLEDEALQIAKPNQMAPQNMETLKDTVN